VITQKWDEKEGKESLTHARGTSTPIIIFFVGLTMLFVFPILVLMDSSLYAAFRRFFNFSYKILPKILN